MKQTNFADNGPETDVPGEDESGHGEPPKK